jgi:hypothetical protein
MPEIDLKKTSTAEERVNICFVLVAVMPALLLIIPCLALKMANALAEEIFQWLNKGE